MQPSTSESTAVDDFPLLVKSDDAARLCGVSERTWRTWDASAMVPRGIHIGRSKFWRTDELRDWVAAGCLPRDVWDLQRDDA